MYIERQTQILLECDHENSEHVCLLGLYWLGGLYYSAEYK